MPDTSAQSKTSLTFLAPKYWPTWLVLAMMWSVARLPFPLQMQIGSAVGLLSYHFARSRRHICEVNLRLCFPELNEEERQKLARKTFVANGIGLIEVAIAWYGNIARYQDRLTVEGVDNLEKAKAKGKGVLLLSAHFSSFELGGSFTSKISPMNVTYRRHRNPLFEAAMLKGRKRHYPQVLEREDVRGAMRSLKAGHTLWYAPDQDYGLRHSVFVPFFGNDAATITATSRFARFNNSAVLFYRHYRNADNSGYLLKFDPVLEDFPSDDDVADARRINALVEDAIRKYPDQYLWLHKRFKTQAAGKDARPYFKTNE